MTSEPDFIVSAADLKKVGFCYARQLDWFRQKGLDFRVHLDKGTPASVLLRTGDGFAIRGVELVRALSNG